MQLTPLSCTVCRDATLACLACVPLITVALMRTKRSGASRAKRGERVNGHHTVQWGARFETSTSYPVNRRVG